MSAVPLNRSTSLSGGRSLGPRSRALISAFPVRSSRVVGELGPSDSRNAESTFRNSRASSVGVISMSVVLTARQVSRGPVSVGDPRQSAGEGPSLRRHQHSLRPELSGSSPGRLSPYRLESGRRGGGRAGEEATSSARLGPWAHPPPLVQCLHGRGEPVAAALPSSTTAARPDPGRRPPRPRLVGRGAGQRASRDGRARRGIPPLRGGRPARPNGHAWQAP